MREDIKKRREKYEVETRAKKLFGGREMIVERKEGMNPVHYKYMRNIQKKALKMLFKQDGDRNVSFAMRPSLPSTHVMTEVMKRKAIKAGYLEEVKPESVSSPNIFTKIFNLFRTVANQNNGESNVSEPVQNECSR